MVNRERAQLLLVTAVLVALAIVGSVTLLNSIYSAGAVQSSAVAGDAVAIEQTHDELQVSLADLFVRVGDGPVLNGTGRVDDFRENVSERLLPLYYRSIAKDSGAAVSVTFNRSRSTTGTGIVQRNDTTFVRPTDSAADWTLARNLDGIVRLRMEIDPDPGRQLSLSAANATTGDRWWLNVSDDAVRVDPADGTTRTVCTLSGVDDAATTHVDVVRTAGTVTVRTDRDVPCGRFELAPGVDSPFALGFVDGAAATGNYTVTHTGGPARSGWSGAAGQPDEVTGIVDPAFDVTYVSSDTSYSAQFTLYNRTEP
jgi:hypothetical protein